MSPPGNFSLWFQVSGSTFSVERFTFSVWRSAFWVKLVDKKTDPQMTQLPLEN